MKLLIKYFRLFFHTKSLKYKAYFTLQHVSVLIGTFQVLDCFICQVATVRTVQKQLSFNERGNKREEGEIQKFSCRLSASK